MSKFIDALNYLKRTRLFRLCILVTFFMSGLMINFLQLLLFIFIKPFDRKLYTKLMYYPVGFLYGQIIFIYEFYSESTMKYYCDPEDFKKMGKEKVFYLANHHYEIDWVISVVFTDKINATGYTRSFIKKMLVYVPVIGWFWKLSDYISLERSFEKDKEVMVNQLTKVAQSSDVLQILFFPEGTRRTEEKMEAARKYALEHNMEPFKHHLIPRTKGFKTCLPVLKKYCDSVVTFDICFEEDHDEVTVLNFLKGKKFKCAGLIKRIPMSEVPEDEDEAVQFMYDVYREKDKAQECFAKHKNFSEVSDLKPFECKPRLSILINELFWMFMSMTPIVVHLVNLLLQGLYYNFVLKLVVVHFIIHLFMQKSLNAADIHKSSSYGRQ